MTSRREPKRERPGMTWALHSLCRPSRRMHLLATCKRAVVLLAALVRSPGGDPPNNPSLPSMDRPADTIGGLGIGRSFADAPGAWGPSAANKLCRVCTGALLRLSSPVHSTPNPAASPSAALPICEKPCSWSPARSSSTLTRPIPYFSSWTKNEPFAGLQGR